MIIFLLLSFSFFIIVLFKTAPTTEVTTQDERESVQSDINETPNVVSTDAETPVNPLVVTNANNAEEKNAEEKNAEEKNAEEKKTEEKKKGENDLTEISQSTKQSSKDALNNQSVTSPNTTPNTSPKGPVTTNTAENSVLESTDNKSESAKKDGNTEQDEDFTETTMTVPTTIQVPIIKKVLPPIKIEEQLKSPVMELKIPGNRLFDILKILSAISGVPIELDLPFFGLMRTAAEDPITLNFKNTTVGDALTKTVNQIKLAIKKESHSIILTIPEDIKTTLIEKQYDITDFLNVKEEKAEESMAEFLPKAITGDLLISILEHLITPESWSSLGGSGSIRRDDHHLIINQTAVNHLEIEKLLIHLRQIQKLAVKEEIPPKKLVPELLGWEKLEEKSTVNYVDTVPLLEVLSFLSQKHKLQILVDEKSLLEMGVNLNTPIVLRMENQSLNHILTNLLNSLHLSYIILGEDMIEITSQEVAESYETVEIHLLSSQEGKVITEEQRRNIPSLLKQTIAPATWGQTDAKVERNKRYFWYDMASGWLIVRQSQPNQRLLRNWLERYLTEEKKGR